MKILPTPTPQPWWERAGMKISAKYTEILLYLPLQTQGSVCGKWVAVGYTAAGGDVQAPWSGIYVWRKAERQEFDARIGKANAVLRELYCSVTTKRELWHTAKLSVFKLTFVPILTYGHESWVMTERILTQVQAPKMGFCEESTAWQKGVPRLDWARGKKIVWRRNIWT